ncbi:hypothetical protein ACF1FY_33955 [Streptomyces althioticus]|uniref:hypothetical protein n=1 Tax=Streptomyces althioticus TaxID=83380 RepID=UPI0036FE0029
MAAAEADGPSSAVGLTRFKIAIKTITIRTPATPMGTLPRERGREMFLDKWNALSLLHLSITQHVSSGLQAAT